MTFGDCAKGTVIVSGLLKVPGMPKLENVFLVNGLKVNLINISQLCDQNLFVQFTKDKCSIIDITNTCVMEGKRSSDNFYLFTCLGTCCTIVLNNLDICHRRFGHISHKNLNETITANAILRIPKMKINLENVCSP